MSENKYFKLPELAKRLGATAARFMDRYGHIPLWFVISLCLLFIVLPLNPILAGSYLWFISKLSAAAALGYGFDWAAFRGEDPHQLEGIEKAMAQTRRATLIAAAMIGAGLIG